MSPKKIALFIVLAISSIMLGAVLGLLDIFGFIDGRHTLSFTLLISTALLIYIILVTSFLLNFTARARVYSFFVLSSIFFAVPFFMMNLNPILTLLSTLIYFTFMVHVYSASARRSELYIKFAPRELFFPIMRSSFTFLLIVLSVLAYTQSQRLVTEKSLISPGLIQLVSKPTIYMVNQQINNQLSSGISAEIIGVLPKKQKKLVIQKSLDETVNQMASQNNGDIYGFTPKEIPTHLAVISEDGTVDISPVIEGMLPSIALRLNEMLSEYAVFAPFVVALLTFLLLQPFLIPLHLIESLITLILFELLLRTGFISLRKEQREVDIPTL